MASNKPYRDSKKVTPHKVTCPFTAKEKDTGFLFPPFTRDLYFSIFPAPVADRYNNDDVETDHTKIMTTRTNLGSGKMGKHYTAIRKDYAKYAANKAVLHDPSLEVVLTCMDSKRVDYVDAVRLIEPYLVSKHGSPFLNKVLMHFRDRVPFQVENYYIVSEHWHNGLSLCHYLQLSERFSEDYARFYLCELASALENIHSRGIIHRCLCLCSILLDPQGHIKLCPYTLCDQNLDCGKPCDPICKKCGDQFYASPEIVFGVDVKPAADWWSLGAIMYQFLTGQIPFTGCTLGELGKAITEETPAYPHQISPLARDLMEKLLHKDPRRRAGWGSDGLCAVKTHPFWNNVNWLSVSQRYLKPPFKPIENAKVIETARTKIMHNKACE